MSKNVLDEIESGERKCYVVAFAANPLAGEYEEEYEFFAAETESQNSTIEDASRIIRGTPRKTKIFKLAPLSDSEKLKVEQLNKKASAVFLGGTCNESPWRDHLIKMLRSNMQYFNPVVKDWNNKAINEERINKVKCDYHLYVITPEMKGVYSIAEVIQSAYSRNKTTIFCVLKSYNEKIFDDAQLRSLKQVAKMVIGSGGFYFGSLEIVAEFLNARVKK